MKIYIDQTSNFTSLVKFIFIGTLFILYYNSIDDCRFVASFIIELDRRREFHRRLPRRAFTHTDGNLPPHNSSGGRFHNFLLRFETEKFPFRLCAQLQYILKS